MIKKIFASIFFVSFFLFAPLHTKAAEQKIGDDLFRFDDVVEISAPVSGDLYAVGGTVTLRGDVAGDVLAAGGTVVVRGSVHGDVRIIGNDVRLESAIDGNVSIAARTLTLATGAHVGKHLSFAGQSLDLADTVGGDARVVLIEPADVHLRSSVIIDGQLLLWSPVVPSIDDGALLRGGTQRYASPFTRAPRVRDIMYAQSIAFFGLFLVGLVVIHLLPRPSLIIASIMNTNIGLQLLWGLCAAVVAIVLTILLSVTIVGVPLALIIGAITAILFYTARVFAGLAIGFMLVARFDRKHRMQSIVLVLLLGSVVLALIESVPLFGLAVSVFATLWALGGIVTFIRTLIGTPSPKI